MFQDMLNFKDTVKVVRLNAPETALTNASFPASGSFEDVADFKGRIVLLISLGVIADALTFKLQQATAVNGTLADISGATKTIAATDDNKVVLIELDPAKLTINSAYRYITATITGVVGTNQAAMFLLFIGKGEVPVTQPASVLTPVVVAG